MASHQSDKEYLQDQIDARGSLKEDGFLITIESFVESGSAYDPIRETVLQTHWCVPIQLRDRDVWGNVLETDLNIVIDGMTEVNQSMIILYNDQRYGIHRINTININNKIVILYELWVGVI